jgi:hypothetical protein
MDADILEALRHAVEKLPEDERKRKVIILGVHNSEFTIEELVDHYAKGDEIGKAFERTVIFNTVLRLVGKK